MVAQQSAVQPTIKEDNTEDVSEATNGCALSKSPMREVLSA